MHTRLGTNGAIRNRIQEIKDIEEFEEIDEQFDGYQFAEVT
jgi:hypothetical protein